MWVRGLMPPSRDRETNEDDSTLPPSECKRSVAGSMCYRLPDSHCFDSLPRSVSSSRS